MEGRTKPTDCMDCTKATGGGGPASGVRVFTVFVLSGSLFLLIYNIGRKRMNAKSSNSGRETTSPVISNPSTLSGYFSHHKDKPLARHRKPSLTAALDHASSSTRSVDGDASSSDYTDHGAPDALQSDGPRGSLKNTPSATPRGSYSRAYDAETGPYMVTRSYSQVSQPSCSYPEPSSSTPGHEEQMMEHMGRPGRFSESRGPITFDPQPRRCSSSVLGDLSQLETSSWSMMDSKNTPDMPSASVKADPKIEDPYGQRSSPIQRDSTMPREHFLKPIIYMFIWSALNYSCHVYSSTGWGAKMTKFPAPFLKTTVLFLMQAIMSSCMLRWPRNNVFVMPWNTYTLVVAPIATAAALDHDLQHASVYMVTLGLPMSNRPTGIREHVAMIFSSFRKATLETVWDLRMQSKGYVPLCVFLFALAFRLETRSIAIAVSVAVIAVGFILGVSTGTKLGIVSLEERSFGPLLSGFRWAAIQVLLQPLTSPGKAFLAFWGSNKKMAESSLNGILKCHTPFRLGLVTPVVTMRALSPSMALVAALLSAFTEPWSSLFTTEEYFNNPEQALMSCAHIIIGALLGTAMALTELVVVYHTSALTLITLGMLKDFVVVVPRMIHNSQFSEENVFGIIIFLFGLVSLIWLKYQKLMKTYRLEEPSQDTQSVASRTSVNRWPRIAASEFTILFSQAQHVREYFGRAQDIGTRASRKLRALWELAS